MKNTLKLWIFYKRGYIGSRPNFKIQGVSKGQVIPYDGDSGPYLEQKTLIHVFRIRPHFQVT